MKTVAPYRLEMQDKALIGTYKDLYDLEGRRLYESVRDDSGIIVNLASKEYSKCIEKYLIKEDRYITVTFCEKCEGKLATKGTYAKMARGEMVRYMAEMKMENPADIKNFDRLGYAYREDLQTEASYVIKRIMLCLHKLIWYNNQVGILDRSQVPRFRLMAGVLKG